MFDAGHDCGCGPDASLVFFVPRWASVYAVGRSRDNCREWVSVPISCTCALEVCNCVGGFVLWFFSVSYSPLVM